MSCLLQRNGSVAVSALLMHVFVGCTWAARPSRKPGTADTPQVKSGISETSLVSLTGATRAKSNLEAFQIQKANDIDVGNYLQADFNDPQSGDLYISSTAIHYRPSSANLPGSPGDVASGVILPNTLNVAVLSPLDCTDCKQNAEDAYTGWQEWLRSVENVVKLPDGTPIAIASTLFPYKDGAKSLRDVAAQIDPTRYHLAIGTSTHFFKEVLEVMQDKQILNIQCEGGNPDVWSELAQKAKGNGKFYGFGIHSSFKEYPDPFLKEAKERLGISNPRVAFVGKLDMFFSKSLCEAANKTASSLGMEVKTYTEITEGGAFLDADILYGCTMNEGGKALMRILSKSGGRRPKAVSISITPSKPWFRKEFGANAAFVTYPGQWHFSSKLTCEPTENFCPKVLSSVDEFRKINAQHSSDGEPSYMRASCAAAGVALETAMQTLDKSDFYVTSNRSRVPDKLYDALNQMNTTSFFGKLTFNNETHMSSRKATIVQFQRSEANPCDVQEIALGVPEGPDASMKALQLWESPPQCGSANSSNSSRQGSSAIFNVAVLSPLDCSNCKQNAEDAYTGWQEWLRSVENVVKLPDGTPITIASTLFPYKDGAKSLRDVAAQIDPTRYHLAIGTNTHFFKEVLEVMQEKQILNIQCDGGNPDVWSELAQKAKANGKFYGFGIHSSFKEYPDPFFKQAKEHLGMSNPKVAFVGKLDMFFSKSLCEAANKTASSLGMEVHTYNEITEGGAFLDADILYGCTMVDDGMALMRILSNSSNSRLKAVSISIAPSKPWFRKEFGINAAYVTYPGQWHFSSKLKCEPTENFCPKVLSSVDEFRKLNAQFSSDGEPSYNRASCAAAGVALETAMQKLGKGDFDSADNKSKMSEKLFQALLNLKTTSFFGELAFHKETHMSSRKATLVQFQPSDKDPCGLQEVALGVPEGPDATVKALQLFQLWKLRAQCSSAKESARILLRVVVFLAACLSWCSAAT